VTADRTVDPSTWTAVDEYVGALCGEDDAMVQTNAAARAAGLPAIGVSAAQGRLLELLVQIQGASRVLEVGTLAGYSTMWLARSLRGPGPHVTTLELDPRHAAVAVENLGRAGLSEVVDVRVGPAVNSLAALVEERVDPFDLVFIDADKPSNVVYLEAALRLTKPGAVIVVDNVVRGGAVADAAAEDERVQGSRAVIDRVAHDPNLSGTVIQTVGAKGYDGFLLVRVAG
jgi:predicted O-methyltransferase YrrM